MILSRFLLRIGNISDKICGGNQNTHFVLSYTYLEDQRYVILNKYSRNQLDATNSDLLVSIFMPIIRRSNCVPLPIVFCPVVAVGMLKSRVARCVHCVGNILHTVYTARHPTLQHHNSYNRTTIDSGTQLDLLIMGIKVAETC